MNKISVMTLGFLKDTVKPYMGDKDGAKLKERFVALFADIKNAGFEAVDLTSFEVRLVGEEFIAERLTSSGLAVASYIHTGRYADAGVSIKSHISDAMQAIDTAVRLGASCFTVVPTAHPDIVKMDKENIFANITANLKPIAEYATANGLIVTVEDYPDPSLHLSSISELDRMLAAIPQSKLVYDSSNMLTVGEDPIKYAEHFKGRIAHVHLKDIEITSEHIESGERTADGRKIRTVFIGTGEVDIHRIVKTLLRDGYGGCFSVEFGDMMYINRASALIEAKKFIVECIKNA